LVLLPLLPLLLPTAIVAMATVLLLLLVVTRKKSPGFLSAVGILLLCGRLPCAASSFVKIWWPDGAADRTTRRAGRSPLEVARNETK